MTGHRESGVNGKMHDHGVGNGRVCGEYGGGWFVLAHAVGRIAESRNRTEFVCRSLPIRSQAARKTFYALSYQEDSGWAGRVLGWWREFFEAAGKGFGLKWGRVTIDGK